MGETLKKSSRPGVFIPLKEKPSFEDFHCAARSCHTPAKFRLLLEKLRSYISYRCLVCGWGNPTTYGITHVVDIDYPKRLLQWYLTTGMLKKDPMIQEWLKTGQPQLWFEAFRRSPDQFDSEYVKKMAEFRLTNTMGGGLVDKELAIYFSLAMESENDCHSASKIFCDLLPSLCLALKKVCDRPALTEQKQKILSLAALGDNHKQIAGKLGISERTVKMHLEGIKKKLYAENITNAVAIAFQIEILN